MYMVDLIRIAFGVAFFVFLLNAAGNISERANRRTAEGQRIMALMNELDTAKSFKEKWQIWIDHRNRT